MVVTSLETVVQARILVCVMNVVSGSLPRTRAVALCNFISSLRGRVGRVVGVKRI